MNNVLKLVGMLGELMSQRHASEWSASFVSACPWRFTMSFHFSHGDDVRLLAGPFSGFTGMVEDINTEKRLLKVKVNVVGRLTTVELSFLDVEKLTFP